MPEKPKPEQYKLDLEEPCEENPEKEIKEPAKEEGPTNNADSDEPDENDNGEIKIIKNDDETCGEGHPKDRSGWN